jgi:3-oxoacyl-(acyl-carrier-protein) synthase
VDDATAAQGTCDVWELIVYAQPHQANSFLREHLLKFSISAKRCETLCAPAKAAIGHAFQIIQQGSLASECHMCVHAQGPCAYALWFRG